MKKILLLACMLSLLSTTGCLVGDGRRHERAHYERHDEVIVAPPIIVVRPPEIIVR